MTISSDGGIDCAALRQELEGSIEADARHARVDAMKKRAIASCSSYDEFRHMVDCAHLTKVTRGELNSLGKVKRGWKKATTLNGGPSSSSADINRLVNINKDQHIAVKHGMNRIPKRSPKTQSEFERDWHRCASLNDKLVYLRNVSPDRVRKGLFTVGLDPQLLAGVLSALSNTHDWNGEELRNWLDALSGMGRLALSVRFLNQEEKHCLAELMDRAEADNSLRQRYSIP